MSKEDGSQFVPLEIISKYRPAYPFGGMAWVPGSTPPEIAKAMSDRGLRPPESPTLEEIFEYPRVAAELYLTRTCALNCIGCSVPPSIRWAKEDRASPEEWMEVNKKLKDKGLLAVKFIGGEVGGLRWLADVAGHAVSLGMHVSIFTDGVPFLDDPKKFERLIEKTGGNIVIHTSIDFPPPKEVIPRAAGLDTDTARRYKAKRGFDMIEMATSAGLVTISHMMIYKPNKDQVLEVYEAIIKRRGIMSLGTMQEAAHLYQGREPETYKDALKTEDAEIIARQMEELIITEDKNISSGGRRTLVNSRAHLATMHTVGITQHIGCANRIGPPAVFVVMPDLSLRHCPVIQTIDQVKGTTDKPGCPGCSYSVFRDGDDRWATYLTETGEYVPTFETPDFPSLFYPTAANNYLKGALDKET